MKTEYKVEMFNDSMQEIYLEFHGPKDKYCEKYAKPEDAIASPDEKSSNKEQSKGNSRKRKREYQSSSEMLNWLRHVAKHSDDPTVGRIPESSKWKEYVGDELWGQLLLVREALFIRWPLNTNAGENLQQDQMKKPRMHPTMYEDDVIDRQKKESRKKETLRCRKRESFLTKFQLCPCCNSSATPKNKVIIHQQEETSNNSVKPPVKPLVSNIKESPINSKDATSAEKQVSVGPSHQVGVPEWTGIISESNPKWLGTRMWPQENSDSKLDHLVNRVIKLSCDCSFSGSVECVRFHIAERRLKLKRELGSLFYRWRFDRMGEEVSLSWTKEEEKIFKDLMRSYAGLPNKFLNNAFRLLPSKKWENLVSYYYNVFLVQRRSYQNRVTPKDIDSDDDEKECGLIGDSFGYKALYIPGSRSVSCNLNMASVELV